LIIEIFELIFDTRLPKSNMKTFVLIILTNLILFYTYWYKMMSNILDSEESYYYGKIDVFNCVLSQPIKIYQYIRKTINKHFE